MVNILEETGYLFPPTLATIIIFFPQVNIILVLFHHSLRKYSEKKSSLGPYFFPKCQNVLSISPPQGAFREHIYP